MRKTRSFLFRGGPILAAAMGLFNTSCDHSLHAPESLGDCAGCATDAQGNVICDLTKDTVGCKMAPGMVYYPETHSILTFKADVQADVCDGTGGGAGAGGSK